MTTIQPYDKYLSCVNISSSEDSTTKLSGFRITGCARETIILNGSSPTIENNIFHGNIIWFDKYEVISCTETSALITRNLFYDNKGLGCVGLREGSAGTKISNNTFNNNRSWLSKPKRFCGLRL